MKQLLTLILSALTQICCAQVADLVLFNGKIFTSDTSGLYVEAIAVQNGRILATGTSAAMEKFTAATSKRIDLGGKLVVPGFNDAHNHLPNALKSTLINLEGLNPSWNSLADSIEIAVKRVPKPVYSSKHRFGYCKQPRGNTVHVR
jgi:predicted amidohydrolase YtcJ